MDTHWLGSLTCFLHFTGAFPGAKEAHQIHAFFSVTYFNTFSSWFKNKNFLLPAPFQIPRSLIVFCEVSEIIASQPALPPSSPFVLRSDFATLDILRHIAFPALSLLIDYYYRKYSFCYYPLSPSLAHKTSQAFLSRNFLFALYPC